jgi:hypothetical protein
MTANPRFLPRVPALRSPRMTNWLDGAPRAQHGGIDEIPLPAATGRLWLCGKHLVGPDPEAAMRHVGADAIVCLVQEFEIADRFPDYPSWLRSNAAERALWFPIPDLDALTLNATRPLIDDVLARVRAGSGVIVHCAAGIGRSGTTAVAVLLHLGMSLDEALTHVRTHRPMAGPEVGRQLDLVRAIAASM